MNLLTSGLFWLESGNSFRSELSHFVSANGQFVPFINEPPNAHINYVLYNTN